MLRMAEIIATSLKTHEHSALKDIAARKTDISKARSRSLIELRLLECENGRLKITPLGNEVMYCLGGSL